MHLTDEEKAILAGTQGEGLRLALRIQTGIGEAMGAEKMVPIGRAHVALSNQEADLWFAKKLLTAGAHCQIAPTVNPGFSLDYFRTCSTMTREDLNQMEETFQVYRDLGARLSFSCTPYMFDNIPRFGEICAFSESSATPFINSVWGARTNREAAQSALCAAVTGRVPLYGLLLAENRLATAVVEVEAAMLDDYDFSLLGWLLPKLISPNIPVLTGLSAPPSQEALTNLGAELNTAGAVPMYHIVGVTPEAPTLKEALGGREPRQVVRITEADLVKTRENMFEPGGPIDFVMFGCPHHTIDQVRRIAQMVEGQSLAREMWVLTSSYTHEMARRMGFCEIIEQAGGHVVPDTCVDQPTWRHLAGKKGATDSPKCAYYLKRRNMSFAVRSLKDCVNAALTGEIQ